MELFVKKNSRIKIFSYIREYLGRISIKRNIMENMKSWVLLLPSLIFFVMFSFYPVIKVIYMSLFHKDLSTPEPVFVGFDNYIGLFEDEVFLKVISNSMFFAVLTVPTSILIGLFMAVILNDRVKSNTFLKTAFFYPTVIPMIAVANIWMFIYTPEYGMLDQILRSFGISGINWLGDSKVVMWSMILMFIWKEAGYLMIFYLAALQNVSQELYEAAEIDGASYIQRFKSITLPLLMPTTLFVSIIALTNSFKLVDHLVIMTQGGSDNASNLLLYHIYEAAFSFWDYGKAATLTVVLLVIMLGIAAIKFLSLDKKIHYS